jgi:hypothetical protein
MIPSTVGLATIRHRTTGPTDKEPLPWFSASSIDAQDAICEQPAERARQGTSYEEICHPPGLLLPAVEGREVEGETREESRLEGAKKESESNQGAKAVGETSADDNDTPANHEAGDLPSATGSAGEQFQNSLDETAETFSEIA